jgi:hypothetical protein
VTARTTTEEKGEEEEENGGKKEEKKRQPWKLGAPCHHCYEFQAHPCFQFFLDFWDLKNSSMWNPSHP